jgi:hypothetical protein
MTMSPALTVWTAGLGAHEGQKRRQIAFLTAVTPLTNPHQSRAIIRRPAATVVGSLLDSDESDEPAMGIGEGKQRDKGDHSVYSGHGALQNQFDYPQPHIFICTTSPHTTRLLRCSPSSALRSASSL